MDSMLSYLSCFMYNISNVCINNIWAKMLQYDSNVDTHSSEEV